MLGQRPHSGDLGKALWESRPSPVEMKISGRESDFLMRRGNDRAGGRIERRQIAVEMTDD